MQKVSLLPSNSLQQSSLSRGPKSGETASKRNKVANAGTGKPIKGAVSETRTFGRKNRNKLENKSSIIRKPIASKADSRVKKNLDSNAKNKVSDKALDKTRPLLAKRESIMLKRAALKKDMSKKVEEVKRPSIKAEKTNIPSKEKSSTDSEFKKKFDSILHKTASNEPRTTSISLQKPKIVAERPPSRSIFSTKSNEKPTLQIETWGPAQAPKPLFNLSKALMRSNIVEKKQGLEKVVPHPENVMKRINKHVSIERTVDKLNATKIWKF